MKLQLLTVTVSALLLSTPAALATDLPADIEECNSDFTPLGTYASCPDFNVSFGKYTYEGMSVSSSTDNGEPVTSSWVAVSDYIVWRSDDEEGTSLCFPKAKATYTETKYPDGTTSSTVEGSSMLMLDESDTLVDGITEILTKPGTFYQEEGVRKVIIAADGITGTITEADGTFTDICELLSSSKATYLRNKKSQTPPALVGALNAAAIQSDLPSCNSLGISSRNTCTNYCIGKGYNEMMSQWNEGVCSCFPKDTMEATPVCQAGGSPPTPPSPTPPSPSPPTPSPPSPTPTCASMGITNVDECEQGCYSDPRTSTKMASWEQSGSDSSCKCGYGGDQYVLCGDSTSGATALSGLMAALLGSATALMMFM